MGRAVKYCVSPRMASPGNPESGVKYYAHVQSSGDITLRELAQRIQQSCTVTKADVFAVLVALEDVMIDALKNSEIVRLGDLGTLRLSVSSQGTATEEEFHESCITDARILFRPGVGLEGALTGLDYQKVPARTSKGEDDGGGSVTPEEEDGNLGL